MTRAVYTSDQNLQRTTLQKLKKASSTRYDRAQLAALRIAYSEDSHLLSNYVNKLVQAVMVFPSHQPTQASGRWSTKNPPITNWPRACINPSCQLDLQTADLSLLLDSLGYAEHEWTEKCWSIRDILLPNPDEVLAVWDHDNIEGRIYDLITNNQVALRAHREGLDLHTITCCRIFGYDLPQNLKNPHTSTEDEAWRAKYNWQGKDTKVRVLAKNFNHGSKYTATHKFVYEIKGIENYGINYLDLEELAKSYIASQGQCWQNKLDIMKQIQRERVARTLYGFRRLFWDSSHDTAKEGFSHMISGTVADFNNETLIKLKAELGSAMRLLHNAHDGDKIALRKSYIADVWRGDAKALTEYLKSFIERDIYYEDRSLTMTAGVKVYL